METEKDNVEGVEGGSRSGEVVVTNNIGEVDVTNNATKAEKRETTENEGTKRTPPPERPRA